MQVLKLWNYSMFVRYETILHDILSSFQSSGKWHWIWWHNNRKSRNKVSGIIISNFSDLLMTFIFIHHECYIPLVPEFKSNPSMMTVLNVDIPNSDLTANVPEAKFTAVIDKLTYWNTGLLDNSLLRMYYAPCVQRPGVFLYSIRHLSSNTADIRVFFQNV